MEIAGRTHALFIRHPWALSAMLSAPPGLNAMRHMEQCLEALAETSMTGDRRSRCSPWSTTSCSVTRCVKRRMIPQSMPGSHPPNYEAELFQGLPKCSAMAGSVRGVIASSRGCGGCSAGSRTHSGNGRKPRRFGAEAPQCRDYLRPADLTQDRFVTNVLVVGQQKRLAKDHRQH